MKKLSRFLGMVQKMGMGMGMVEMVKLKIIELFNLTIEIILNF